MSVTTASLTNTYDFPVGRRVFVQREVERRARDRGITTVADKAAQGLAHDTALLGKRIRLRASFDRLYGDDAVQLDNQVDHCVTGFDGYLESQERMFLGESRSQAAAQLRRALLPEGPGAVIRLPYAQQHAEVDALLARLEEPDLTAYLAELEDVMPRVARLQIVNQRYGEVLNSYQVQPSADELKAGDVIGQELLAETLVLIQAHFITNAPQDQEGRAYLLEPILRQNDAIRASRRRRRPPRDIDPDTGVDLPESDEPVEDESASA
ncbi:MAG TPA: DUF6261 family protein [Haliangium sp.]|nr:DUF6261 family protein [Haliangium sp.]